MNSTIDFERNDPRSLYDRAYDALEALGEELYAPLGGLPIVRLAEDGVFEFDLHDQGAPGLGEWPNELETRVDPALLLVAEATVGRRVAVRLVRNSDVLRSWPASLGIGPLHAKCRFGIEQA